MLLEVQRDSLIGNAPDERPHEEHGGDAEDCDVGHRSRHRIDCGVKPSRSMPNEAISSITAAAPMTHVRPRSASLSRQRRRTSRMTDLSSSCMVHSPLGERDIRPRRA